MRNWIVVACLLGITPGYAQVFERSGRPLTLDEAWRMAEQNSVSLKAARAAVDAAQGQVQDTNGLLWNNPELSAERARRKSPAAEPGAATVREWSAGLAQTLEIAGQQGHRRHAARQELDAARFTTQETEREIRAETERRFVQVLALQARLTIERQSLALVENTAAFAAKRLAAGEDTKLDSNVAAIEAGRARNQLAALTDQLLQARVELGELLQWPATGLPEVVGELETRTETLPLDPLLVRAAERAGLKALLAKEGAAQSRLSLERAARIPDITVGLGVAREGPQEFREKVTLLSVTVPLPLFKRNAGNVAQARADLTRALTERQAAERDNAASVRALHQRFENLKARVQTLRQTVIPALEENQRLSQRALTEGEISLAQQVLINRQVVDGRRDLLDAITELRATRIALDLAAGTPPDALPR